ncbi:MAG: hypothetical protein JJU05_09875 [Verrucomicrobia bacterium]|nr:hypothetical protein [Verrucomicrobiota bacterium]MCH8527543.1 hypothetical protein [Kiritimatiellia bacterium]
MTRLSSAPSRRPGPTTIAWGLSLLINLSLMALLWANPGLRQRTMEFILQEDDPEAAAELERKRGEVEERMERRRERTPIDERTREQILDRLEREKTHRGMDRVRELYEIHTQLEERRQEEWEKHHEQFKTQPERDAAERLQEAVVDLQQRQTALALRLNVRAETQAEARERQRQAEQSEAVRTLSEQTREQAGALSNQAPPQRVIDALESIGRETLERVGQVNNTGPDRITASRAQQTGDAANRMLEALSEVEAARGQVAEAPPLPESEPLSDLTQRIVRGEHSPGLEEAHTAATELEKRIAGAYDEVRSAKYAQSANVSPDVARDRVMPTEVRERPNPFAGLEHPAEGPASGHEQIRERTRAMDEAERQIREIAGTARHRLGQVEERGARTEERPVDANRLFAERQLSQQAQSRRRFTDVAGLMRQAMGDGGQEGGQAAAEGESAVRSADQPAVRRASELPPESVLNALPGRRFSADSPRKGWLYIDTWYVIGPWNSHDLTTFPALPPEQEIDFDAVYPGMVYNEAQAAGDRRRGIDRGFTVGQPRPLRWQFTQSDGPRVVVPDSRESAAYYAFTEIYFEQPGEMIVAVATDDAGKVWINGFHVATDTGLAPWRIDESLVRVWFKQGYNTILVRVDNGPRDCEFSFLITPPDALEGHQIQHRVAQ